MISGDASRSAPLFASATALIGRLTAYADAGEAEQLWGGVGVLGLSSRLADPKNHLGKYYNDYVDA